LADLHRHLLLCEYFLDDVFRDMRLEHPSDILPVVPGKSLLWKVGYGLLGSARLVWLIAMCRRKT
jgi:hypothetical protein